MSFYGGHVGPTRGLVRSTQEDRGETSLAHQVEFTVAGWSLLRVFTVLFSSLLVIRVRT